MASLADRIGTSQQPVILHAYDKGQIRSLPPEYAISYLRGVLIDAGFEVRAHRSNYVSGSKDGVQITAQIEDASA